MLTGIVARLHPDRTASPLTAKQQAYVFIFSKGKLGLRIVARPTKGFAYYAEAEFRPSENEMQKILMPNQIIDLNIILHRFVAKNVFQFGPATDKLVNFKGVKSSGETLV